MTFHDLEEGILEEFSSRQAPWSLYIQGRIESYRSWKNASEAQNSRIRYATDSGFREKRKTNAKETFKKRYDSDPEFRARHLKAKNERRALQKAEGKKRTS